MENEKNKKIEQKSAKKKTKKAKSKGGKRFLVFLLVLLAIAALAAVLLLPRGGVLNHYFGFDVSEKVPALSFLSAGKNTDSHTHEYGDWEVVADQTCGENGMAKRTCACGAIETRTLFATGEHQFRSTDHVCTVCGAKERSSYAGKVVTFGEYPQTLKSPAVNVTSTQDARGYYLGSDGAYYAKVKAVAYVHRSIYGNNYATGFHSNAYFANGTKIEYNTDYYFKVEPIRWRVLSEENGTALLLCESILETLPMDTTATPSNSYAITTLYDWLTTDFKNTAFSAAEQAKLVATTIKNDADVFAPGVTVEENAPLTETIFLLSYADMLNEYYGFSAGADDDDAARAKIASDYTRARGIYYENDTGCGLWWLRTPRSKTSDISMTDVVNTRGNTNVASDVKLTFIGASPAISVKISDLDF